MNGIRPELSVCSASSVRVAVVTLCMICCGCKVQEPYLISPVTNPDLLMERFVWHDEADIVRARFTARGLGFGDYKSIWIIGQMSFSNGHVFYLDRGTTRLTCPEADSVGLTVYVDTKPLENNSRVDLRREVRVSWHFSLFDRVGNLDRCAPFRIELGRLLEQGSSGSIPMPTLFLSGPRSVS